MKALDFQRYIREKYTVPPRLPWWRETGFHSLESHGVSKSSERLGVYRMRSTSHNLRKILSMVNPSRIMCHIDDLEAVSATWHQAHIEMSTIQKMEWDSGRTICPRAGLNGNMSSYCWKSETVVRVSLLPQVSNIPHTITESKPFVWLLGRKLISE